MKKSYIKLIALLVALTLTLGLSACTYRANGSVIQDVTFDINYEVDGETKTINSTLSLYKTFAPETTKRVLSLIKSGFYSDSAITVSKQQDYAVIGSFDYADGDYVVKNSTESGIRGEFTQNGWRSRLSVKPGALVMLRDFDIEDGERKYDTAKASFAIVLTSESVLNATEYCVFGYIDDASIESIKTALVDEAGDNGYFKARYLGKRENGVQTFEGGFDYYINADKDYFKLDKDGSKIKLEYATEDDVDYDMYETIKDADTLQDIFVLPKTVFTVKNFKLK